MWYNTTVYTSTALGTMTDVQILSAIYSLLLNAIMFFVGLTVFYFVFKIAVWFIPNYWHKAEDRL